MNYLPINQEILNKHKADCWAYYCYLYKCINHTYLNFLNTITIAISIDAAKSHYGRAYADLGTTVWKKYKPEWETDQILIVGTPTTMMPLEVFDKVHQAIITLPSRSRSSYCRFYLYMYNMCHAFKNDYGVNIDRLCAMLTSNNRDMTKKIQFFIEAGLLRRMGKFNPDLGIPYRYFIPPEYCCSFN